MPAICQSPDGPPATSLRARHAPRLNNWDIFWLVLDHPELPLGNHEAERARRQLGVARRIGLGTRTRQATRAFALLTSVIETRRKRPLSPWPYFARAICQRGKGLPAPPLPFRAIWQQGTCRQSEPG